MTHGGAALPPSPSPLLHRPATPSELLTHTLAYLRHPTTLIVCWPRQQFVEALVQDICQQQQEQQQPRAKPGGRQAGGDGSEDEDVHAGDGNDGDGDGGGGTSQQLPQPVIPAHQLLSATLLQVSISRHIRMLFVPSVVHLRAHLAAPPASPVSLSSSTLPPGQPPRSKITAPPDNGAGAHAASPNSRTPTRQPRPQQHRQAPLLLIYGLFELHRDGTDWSAQGLNASLAVLVECAARSGLVPALVEPRRMERDDSDVDGGVQGGGGRGSSAELLAALAEPIPVLSGSERRRDGSWSGRTVPVRRVLARWFDLPSSPTG